MEIEIISKEFIKPSSPTPHHLRTHKLSLFDQITPSMYIPMVLFYPIDNNHHQYDLAAVEATRSQLLKKSLSQTLSRFYPLAGRIKDNLSIDCNDAGVCYVEARVKYRLFEFLNKPDFSLINQLLPSDRSWVEAGTGDCVAMIQVSTFDCGGIVVGSFISHMIMDGHSLSTFLNDWAKIANKGAFDDDGAIISCFEPDFTRAPSLYPQNTSLPKEITMMGIWYPFFKKGKAVVRRFVFDASALARLKAKASSPSVQNPTRVEVVTAVICKCAMTAFKATSGGIQNPFLLTHVVNLRKKAIPPFNNYLMGNLLVSAVAEFTTNTKENTELSHLERELKEALRKVNGNLLKTLEGDQGFYRFCKALKEIGGAASNAVSSNKAVDFIGFSSWCNIGLYEVDFGWGKPMWVTSTAATQEEGTAMLNFVLLTETRRGDGIEAWVTMDEQDMSIIECNQELLAFASLDPSPLQIDNLLNRTQGDHYSLPLQNTNKLKASFNIGSIGILY